MQINELMSLVMESLDEMKASDIITIDVKKISSVTDVMVVCSGRSDRHVKSIGQALVEKTKHQGHPALSIEGLEHGEWVLIDLGDVVVHVMLPTVRSFYDIEGLWSVEA